MKFGERLKISLNIVGVSQQILAERTGLLPSNVSHFIHCRREPSLPALVKIIDALPAVDARWLITGKKKP